MAQTLTLDSVMRYLAVVLLVATVSGCAARSAPPGPQHAGIFDDESFIDDATTAAALIFDPPIMINEPPLELARDIRQPAAFVSYDEVFSTYFYLRVHDRQVLTDDHRSERRVISETFGVTHR